MGDQRAEDLDKHGKLVRSQGTQSAQWPTDGMNYPVIALRDDPRLSGPANGRVRAALMRQMQRTYGNRAVQRVVGNITSVQRDPPSGAPANAQNASPATRVERAWTADPRDYRTAYVVLNGLNMTDLLMTLSQLTLPVGVNPLINDIQNAQGVNRDRLLAAMYAVAGRKGPEFDGYVRSLPQDQQQAIRDWQDAGRTPSGITPNVGDLMGSPQQIAQVRQWIEDHTWELRNRVGSGMDALVVYVQTSAPGASLLVDARVRSLLAEWAGSHNVAIPQRPIFGRPGAQTVRRLEVPAAALESALGGLVQNIRVPENKDPHAGADVQSGVNPNVAAGVNPGTYTITIVWRNADAMAASEDATAALDVLHEPNISVQIQPDPANPAVYQAAITLINLHLRSHGRELIELSTSIQGQATLGSAPGAGAQAQVELHMTLRFSLTLSTGVGGSPDSGEDAGSVPIGSAFGLNWRWSPFNAGALVHFD